MGWTSEAIAALAESKYRQSAEIHLDGISLEALPDDMQEKIRKIKNVLKTERTIWLSLEKMNLKNLKRDAANISYWDELDLALREYSEIITLNCPNIFFKERLQVYGQYESMVWSHYYFRPQIKEDIFYDLKGDPSIGWNFYESSNYRKRALEDYNLDEEQGAKLFGKLNSLQRSIEEIMGLEVIKRPVNSAHSKKLVVGKMLLDSRELEYLSEKFPILGEQAYGKRLLKNTIL